MESILSGRNLNKTYINKDRKVMPLQNIDFDLYPGEILGVVGESGSGKSTLLRVISGIEKPDSGRLFFRGEDYTGAGPEKTGRFLQMIFQDAYGSFDPRMTMEKSLMEATGLDRDGILRKDVLRNEKLRKDVPRNEKLRKDVPRNEKLRKDVLRNEMLRIVREVGLEEELLTRRPKHLSGGQCQRMSIARALLSHAGILLCDEITSALDVTTQAQVIRLITEIREKEEVSVIFVSHDLALVSMICDRIMVMKDGVLVEEGKTADIIEHPAETYTRKLLDSIITID